MGTTFFHNLFVPERSERNGLNNDQIAPSRSWEHVNENTAKTLLGNYATPLNRSMTVKDYTITLDSYIIDENGMGAIAYTLSNPNGLEEITYGEYGDYSLSPDSPLTLPSLCSAADKLFDSYSIVDLTYSNETVMHAVLYFAPFEKLSDKEPLQFTHTRVKNENFIEFVPDRFIPSITYKSETGYTAHLSPVGILFDGPIFETVSLSWIWDKLTITFQDGSVYQAKDTDIFNHILSCFSTDTGDSYLVFNRMVDTAQVASITIDGPTGEDLIFTQQ